METRVMKHVLIGCASLAALGAWADLSVTSSLDGTTLAYTVSGDRKSVV